MDKERIKHIFQFVEYDELTEDEEDLIISFEEQYNDKGYLSPKQFKILESIFGRAATRVKWSR